MSIRTWVFLALLAITLMGVGGISDAYAQVVCDPDEEGYDAESSCWWWQPEEDEVIVTEDVEDECADLVGSMLDDCRGWDDDGEDGSEPEPVEPPEPPEITPEPPQPPEPAPEITPEPEMSCDEVISENPEPMTTQESNLGMIAVAEAERHRDKPYMWGAKGPHAFDCSGLVSAAWRAAGVKLPVGNAQKQYEVTTRVDFEDKQPGDLLFFGRKVDLNSDEDFSDDGETHVTHVGMYVGQDDQGRDRMIHAPGKGKPVDYEVLEPKRLEKLVGVGRPSVE